MQDRSDVELLREYTAQASEAAFREIVTRHADLVYASALRQVRSPELAQDIAQTVFTDLVRKAPALGQTLSENASLVGWLYRSTRFAAHTRLRDDWRRQARERQAMDNFDTTSETATEWDRVGPVLDEAMADLSDEDREALLLRFFKNHDFRTIGLSLGVSDDAAQKRVSRALERLRAKFHRRGVTTSAVALSTAVSANAVSVAPAGLAATLSTVALSGTAIATTATATATAAKTIAMTTLQKAVITTAFAVAVGTGIYQARQASNLRTQVQALQETQAQQVQQLQSDRDNATQQLAALRDDNERLNRKGAELLTLRAEIARLRSTVTASQKGVETGMALTSWLNRLKEFKRLQTRMPDKMIPELRLLTEEDWLELAKEPLGHSASEVNLEDDAVARLVFSDVRVKAKDKLMRVLSRALVGYADANNGQLPTDTVQLEPYLMNSHFLGPARVVQIPEGSVDDTMLQRYEILQTGKLADVPEAATIIAEKAPVDNQYDTRLRVGKYWFGVATGPDAYSQDNLFQDGKPVTK